MSFCTILLPINVKFAACNYQAQEVGERECMEVATMLSEVDRRIAETKKDMYEFKRDVIGEPALRACSQLQLWDNIAICRIWSSCLQLSMQHAHCSGC